MASHAAVSAALGAEVSAAVGAAAHAAWVAHNKAPASHPAIGFARRETRVLVGVGMENW